jgi:glutathione S-transferase
MLTLYHNNLSVCSQKVRIHLAEKDLPWEGRHVGLMQGEHLRPEFKNLNPRGLVPTLVHDGAVIIESTVILEYIEDTFPERPLRPEAPALRARMRVWEKIPDDGLHTACATISFASVFAEQLANGLGPEELERRLANMPDQERATRQRTLMREGFGAPFVKSAVRAYENLIRDMEEGLQHGPWLVGEQFTLADIALIPYLARLDRLGFSQMWQRSRPRVTEWFARAQARPSFKTAVDDFQPVDYDDLLRKRGVNLWPKLEPLLQAA